MTGRSSGTRRPPKPAVGGRATGKPATEHPPTLPWWKRLLIALAFAGGGGAFAAWGVHDLMAWIAALRHGAASVETESGLLGVVPLGVGIAAIGPFALMPPAWAERRKRALAIAVGAIFTAMIGGLLLILFGNLAITGIMRGRGYHDCETRHGRRVSFTTWAAADISCPPVPDER